MQKSIYFETTSIDKAEVKLKTKCPITVINSCTIFSLKY